MQEPRRWRWLQLHLLSLTVACGSAAPASPGPSAPSTDDSAQRSGSGDKASEGATEASKASAAAKPEPPVEAELPQGSRVLQVGDSFADALGLELGKLLKQSGLRTSLETKTPSYIGEWAYGAALPKAIAQFNPDLVLVTLGANELEIPEPQQRVGPVQRLVKSLGGRPCVWILPPLYRNRWRDKQSVL